MLPKKVHPAKVVYRGDNNYAVKKAKVDFGPHGAVQWNYTEFHDVVAVVAVDKKGLVYLAKEWRLAWNQEILQIPGGVCKSRTEKGRVQQVHNELREEIGIDAKKIRKLGQFYMSSRIRCMVHLYLATDLFEAKKKPDDFEFIEVVTMPFDRAYKRFVSGKNTSTGYTLAAFLLAKEKMRGSR